MQHFSNYFVQILVITSKCQGEKRGQGGGGSEKNSRGQMSLLPAPMRRADEQEMISSPGDQIKRFDDHFLTL